MTFKNVLNRQYLINMNYLSSSLVQLLYCGFLLLAIPDSAMMFFAISLAMSIVAGNNVLNYIKKPFDICFFDFFATSILLAYALSTLITQVKIYSLKSVDVARYFDLGQSSLSIALAGVSFASAALIGLSRLLPTPLRLPIFNRQQLNEGLFVILFVAISSIYCVKTGLMAFQGLMFTDSEHPSISPFASMVSFALAPAGIMAMFMASGRYEVSQLNRWVLYALAATLWLVTFTQGRRLLVYLALLYLIFYAFDASGRFVWKKKLIFTMVVGFIAYFGIKLFFAFRVAGWDAPGKQDAIQLLHSAIDILSHPSKYDFDYLLSETSLERPFVIKYFSQIIDKTSFEKWMFGEAMFATLLFSIPSALIGSKAFKIDEELIHPRIGLPIIDEANTILTTGFSDFGWFGMIIYPVIVLLVLRCLILIVRKSGIRWLDYFVQFGVLFLLLNVESSMAAYWSFVRSTLIILAIALSAKLLLNTMFVRKPSFT